MDKLLVVTVPIANIRCEPVDAQLCYLHDDLQETQVLYNEILLCCDEIENWYYVEAIEQLKSSLNNISQGYPGWIRKKCVAPIHAPLEFNAVIKNKTACILKDPSEESEVLLLVSVGTKFKVIGETGKVKSESKKKQGTGIHINDYYMVETVDNKNGWVNKDDVNIMGKALDESVLRKAIIDTAELFLGVPYLWGGRSMFIPELSGQRPGARRRSSACKNAAIPGRDPWQIATGVDCSGLTNLVYRVNNIDIPRDAHEQWMAAEKIAYQRLKPGDFIFVSVEGNQNSINHVMLYSGKTEFIEAAETGSVVRANIFAEKFGKDLPLLAQQDFIVDRKQLHFGRVVITQ